MQSRGIVKPAVLQPLIADVSGQKAIKIAIFIYCFSPMLLIQSIYEKGKVRMG